MTVLEEGQENAGAPRRVALVGCGKAKQAVAAPARELYTSNLFRLSAQYAAGRRFDAWYVISARHAAVDPDAIVKPYDWSLRQMRQSEREAWAARVASAVVTLERGARFTLLAGGPYGELAAYLRWTMHAHYIGPLQGLVAGVEEPLLGMQIGQRMAWLKQKLEGEGSDDNAGD